MAGEGFKTTLSEVGGSCFSLRTPWRSGWLAGIGSCVRGSQCPGGSASRCKAVALGTGGMRRAPTRPLAGRLDPPKPKRSSHVVPARARWGSAIFATRHPIELIVYFAMCGSGSSGIAKNGLRYCDLGAVAQQRATHILTRCSRLEVVTLGVVVGTQYRQYSLGS